MRTSTGAYEAAEDCVARMLLPRQKFLVPLESDSEGMARHFDRLNGAVARVGSGLDAATNDGSCSRGGRVRLRPPVGESRLLV